MRQKRHKGDTMGHKPQERRTKGAKESSLQTGRKCKDLREVLHADKKAA